MSFKDLKNTLKACQSSFSSSISTSSQFRLDDTNCQPPAEKRKPPKTSLKQQLAGLEQLESTLHAPENQSAVLSIDAQVVAGSRRGTKKRSVFSETDGTLLCEDLERQKHEENEEVLLLSKVDEDDEVLNDVGDSEAGVFVQPHTEGPFEPLILEGSSDNGRIVQRVVDSTNGGSSIGWFSIETDLSCFGRLRSVNSAKYVNDGRKRLCLKWIKWEARKCGEEKSGNHEISEWM